MTITTYRAANLARRLLRPILRRIRRGRAADYDEWFDGHATRRAVLEVLALVGLVGLVIGVLFLFRSI